MTPEQPNEFQERVKFLTCPKCRLAIRVDDANHANECHGRAWNKGDSKEAKTEAESYQRPVEKNPPGKKARRRAEARRMKEKPAIPSSWRTEGTKKIRSIISTPFESRRRRH